MAIVGQLLFSGLAIGGVYALVALGIALIYRAPNVVNFAQGEFCMLGAYALVRLRWRGAGFISTAILLTYLMPGIMLVVPLYQIFAAFRMIQEGDAIEVSRHIQIDAGSDEFEHVAANRDVDAPAIKPNALPP